MHTYTAVSALRLLVLQLFANLFSGSYKDLYNQQATISGANAVLMKRLLLICCIAALSGCALLETAPQPQPAAGPYKAISLDGMSDSIKHWRNRYGSNYAKYTDSQIVEIANNVLLYQRDNGGWVENRDPSRILNAKEIAEIMHLSPGTTNIPRKNIRRKLDIAHQKTTLQTILSINS